jgi:phage FluMu protein Com
MLIKCPQCNHDHELEPILGSVLRAGALMYVDRLCPWCRSLYSFGQLLNSPLGAVLCGIAVATVINRLQEKWS